MKKYLISTLALTMAMTTATFAETTEEVRTISYTLEEGTEVEDEEVEEYILARSFAEELGYEVSYDGETKVITFTKGENEFRATVGSKEFYSDVYGSESKIVELDSETIIVDGLAYVPTAFGKMLRDVPVIDPVAPERNIEDLETLTPVVDVVEERDLSDYETITPEMPVIEGERDLSQYETLTPEMPVAEEVAVKNTVDTIMDVDVAIKIAEDVEAVMEQLEEEQLLAIEEDKAAFLAEGGSEAKFIEPVYEIGYEVGEVEDGYVTVRIYRLTKLGSLDSTEIYRIYDVETGTLITR